MKKFAMTAFGTLSALVLFTGCCNTCSPGGCSSCGSCGSSTYGAPIATPTYGSASPAYTTPPVYSTPPAGQGTIVTPPVVQ